ncbi:hypothetical protein ACF8C4_01550 [Myroides odoratimimus]|uniref:hypothetical protein n=1 Tax=Myroides TaxID=76831 RepID=UPI002575CFDA|nr:hypothetical protein [Myroides odoratimimus]MDM1513730.1 hypothetical protein [Myroides odoratimimus]
MVILIIIAVAIFLWWSLVPSKKKVNNRSRTSSYTSNEDELKRIIFLNRYNFLVDDLIKSTGAEIVDYTSYSIRMEKYTKQSTSLIHIYESSGYYNVVWEFESMIYGKNNLAWKFPIGHSQYHALENIKQDVDYNEQKMITEKFGLRK